MFFKKLSVFVPIFVLALFVFSSIGHPKQLPLENQPLSSIDTIAYKMNKEKSEYEIQEEFENRVEKFYAKNRTIFFYEVDIYHDYNASTETLTLNHSGYTPYYQDQDYFDTPFEYDYNVDPKNPEEFSHFESVKIQMSPEKAESVASNLSLIVGIEFIFNPNAVGEGVTKSEYTPSYDDPDDYEKRITYTLHPYIKSMTIYNTNTNEILRQEHTFADDSPVWGFNTSDGEDGDDGTDDSNDGGGGGGGGCAMSPSATIDYGWLLLLAVPAILARRKLSSKHF